MESNLPVPGQRNVMPGVFWGMAVFLVILLNTHGNVAASFLPLPRLGFDLAFAALIFPSFLFAVGNAIFFAEGQWRQSERQEVLIAILNRTLVIFSVGVGLALVLNAYLEVHHEEAGWEHLRVMAVLQRIALSYGLAAVAVLYFSEYTIVLIAMASLLAYWLSMNMFGDLTASAAPVNVVRHFDMLLSADAVLHQERGVVFGPEGLLTALPATANVLGGYMAARFIRSTARDTRSTALLLLIGNVLIFLALWWNVGPWSGVNWWTLNRKL
jgi:predicted acyltransferase